MDKAISATEANQRFSELLREVANGESFTVTSRGRPVARVIPVEPEDQRRKIELLLEYVRKQPIRRAGPWKREDLYD
jgi:prevent-host-death family protein